MKYPVTWNTIMHFEDLAENGERSIKCSLMKTTTGQLKMSHYIMTLSLPTSHIPTPWVFLFCEENVANVQSWGLTI